MCRSELIKFGSEPYLDKTMGRIRQFYSHSTGTFTDPLTRTKQDSFFIKATSLKETHWLWFYEIFLSVIIDLWRRTRLKILFTCKSFYINDPVRSLLRKRLDLDHTQHGILAAFPSTWISKRLGPKKDDFLHLILQKK